MTNPVPALPAYLTALAGRTDLTKVPQLGSGPQHPRVSIDQNRFTLIDPVTQKEQILTTMDPQLGVYMDAVVVDIAQHKSKVYRAVEYDPADPQPPTCYSTFGDVPDAGAQEPQAETCNMCKWSKFGSAINALNKKTWACRDYVVIVLYVAPHGYFRFNVMPGSFQNFNAYKNQCIASGLEPQMVITRFSFDNVGKNGIVRFTPIGYLPENLMTYAANDEAIEALVDSRTVQSALPAPSAQPAIQPSAPAPVIVPAPSPTFIDALKATQEIAAQPFPTPSAPALASAPRVKRGRPPAAASATVTVPSTPVQAISVPAAQPVAAPLPQGQSAIDPALLAKLSALLGK